MSATLSDTEREEFLEAAGQGMTLAFWAGRQPDVPAIIGEHGDRTYAELNAHANQLVRALRARGVTEGDALGLMCANRPQFAETLGASLRSGMRLTTINWHLTGEEAGYILNDCEAKVFVADARFAEAARGALEHAPNATVRISVGGDIEGFEPFESVIEGQDPSDIDAPVVGGQMLYTSGTTGRPKGVSRPRTPDAAKLVAGAMLAGPTKYQPGVSVNLCTGPLYHAAPLAFSLATPLLAGATVVLMDGWSAADTLRLIDEHKVTHIHMVPTMFHRLLSLPDDVKEAADIESVHYIVHGAAPCPVVVKKGIIDWFGPVVNEYYAATEGAGTTIGSKEWLEKPGTVGKPPTPDHIRILDEDGNDLAAGEIGTVYLKAPPGRFEYYKDPDKTASSYRDTHYTLGDVGYLDDDGYLFLTDRSANLIISGGVNIYPAEVEAELIGHPAVGDVAVIGVPDDEWGEVVVAVIEPQPDVEPSPELADELVAFARDRLAHYKCPRRVDFRGELPRHDNGKLYKRLLRDEYRAAVQAEEASK